MDLQVPPKDIKTSMSAQEFQIFLHDLLPFPSCLILIVADYYWIIDGILTLMFGLKRSKIDRSEAIELLENELSMGSPLQEDKLKLF